MSIGLPQAESRQFTARIVLPVVLSLAAMVGIVGGFVIWSTSNSDARAVQRQTALIDHAMRSEIKAQANSQESSTIWEEAVVHTRGRMDRDWVDENLGTYFYKEYGYEQTAVLDEKDRPLYLMHDGSSVNPRLLMADMDELEPLVARLRADIDKGALRAYLGGARSTMPYAADYVTISGAPAMVTVAPIASGTERSPGEQPFVHIAVDFLDDSYASFLGEANVVDNAQFRLATSGNPDNAALPLINEAGRIVAFFEWRQDWPGRRLLSETIVALGAALLIVGLLILALVRRVMRYSSELENGRVRAEHQAHHDALTGLPNRAFFETSLQQATGKGQIALFMLDLDRFKQVNDTLGHPAGDELIRAVGERLRNSVSAGATISRLGGDEFAIIEPTISGPAEALALAGRIVEVIGRPFMLFGNEASVGVSIGIGMGGDAAATPAELVRRADIALYEAKANGRNRAQVYDPSMDVAVQQRHSIEAELREALRAPGQIDVVFEPIVAGEDGRIVGAEALPRWTHPRQGEVPREIFLNAAESAGLVEELGERVLREACRLGAGHCDRVISVNVSLAQLRNPRFFSRLFDLLSESGMRPANLELEIAERVLLGGKDVAGDVLRKLQAAGIRIALDDFGTGYSSLNFLKQYDVDYIKIDRAFAQETGDDRSTLAIVQAMVTLAHAMKVNVTAKGIDTPLQKSRFTGIGCDRLQGALISPPLGFTAMAAAFAGDDDDQRPTRRADAA